MIASAEFPVEGLGFDETGVTMNDLPFVQASDALKLRVSVAMGMKMNPELRVLLIRNGSLLDEDNLAMIAEMAEESNSQVWLEKVGKSDDVTVLIEDGMVAEEEAADLDLGPEYHEPDMPREDD